MLDTTQIQVRMSELRESINKRIEVVDEDQRAAVRELTDLESAYRQALAAGEREVRESDTEFRALSERVDVGRYVRAALDGVPVDGAERELNDELGLGPDMMPISALQSRADTVAPSDAGPRRQRVVMPVFQESIAGYLGASVNTVGMGESSYAILADDIAPDYKAAAAAADEQDPAFTVETLKPRRLTGYLTFRVEDAALMPIEDALRSALRRSMVRKFDREVLNGSGVSPQQQGILAALTAFVPATADSATTTPDQTIQRLAGLVDGRYASGGGDLRLLVGPEVYARMASVMYASGEAVTLLEKMSDFVGDIRVSDAVPDAGNQRPVVVAKGRHSDSIAVAVWEGVRLIRDDVSLATTGRVRITAVALNAIKVLRPEVYAKVGFKPS